MKTKEDQSEEQIRIQPTKGMRFIHARVLGQDGTLSQLFRVTRIAQGVAFYRPIYADGSEGKALYCDLTEFSTYCKEIVLTRAHEGKGI